MANCAIHWQYWKCGGEEATVKHIGQTSTWNISMSSCQYLEKKYVRRHQVTGKWLTKYVAQKKKSHALLRNLVRDDYSLHSYHWLWSSQALACESAHNQIVLHTLSALTAALFHIRLDAETTKIKDNITAVSDNECPSHLNELLNSDDLFTGIFLLWTYFCARGFKIMILPNIIEKVEEGGQSNECKY